MRKQSRDIWVDHDAKASANDFPEVDRLWQQRKTPEVYPIQLNRSSSSEKDGNFGNKHTSVPSEGNDTSTDQPAKTIAPASLKTTSASPLTKQTTSGLDNNAARGESAEVHSHADEDDLSSFSCLPTPPHSPRDNQLSAEKLEQVSPLDEAINRMERDFLQNFPEASKKARFQPKEMLELPPRAYLLDSFNRRVPLATVSTNSRPMLGQEDSPSDPWNMIPRGSQPLVSEAEPGAPQELKGISTWHAAYRTSYVQELQTAADRILPRTSIWRDSDSSWSLRERHCSRSEPAYDQLQ